MKSKLELIIGEENYKNHIQDLYNYMLINKPIKKGIDLYNILNEEEKKNFDISYDNLKYNNEDLNTFLKYVFCNFQQFLFEAFDYNEDINTFNYWISILNKYEKY